MSAPRLAPNTGFADGAIALVTFPTGLVVPDARLSRNERLSRIRAALSLRICAGLFSGSMRGLARANGCSVQSLSRRAREMAAELGIELHFLTDKHREALAAAQLELWRRRKLARENEAALARLEDRT